MGVQTTQVDFAEGERGEEVDTRAAKLLEGMLTRSRNVNFLALRRNADVREALAALEAQLQRDKRAAMTPAFKDEVLVWAAATVQKRTPRADWEKLLLSNTAKSWKALRDFPKSIRKLAEKIDKLNQDFFGQKNAKSIFVSSFKPT